MKTVLAFIAKVLADVLSAVISDLLKTPAVKEKINVQEGDAPAPDVDYGAAYGLHDRGEEG